MVAGPELALTGASHRDGDLGLEPISDSKNSDSDDSSEGLEERPLPVLSLAPVPPPVATAPPSPPPQRAWTLRSCTGACLGPAKTQDLVPGRDGHKPGNPRCLPQGAGVLPRSGRGPRPCSSLRPPPPPRLTDSSRRRWASSPLGPTGRSQARRLAHVRTRSPCWAQARHTCWDFLEAVGLTWPPPPPLPSARPAEPEAEQVTAARRIWREGVSLGVAPGQVPRERRALTAPRPPPAARVAERSKGPPFSPASRRSL